MCVLDISTSRIHCALSCCIAFTVCYLIKIGCSFLGSFGAKRFGANWKVYGVVFFDKLVFSSLIPVSVVVFGFVLSKCSAV